MNNCTTPFNLSASLAESLSQLPHAIQFIQFFNTERYHTNILAYPTGLNECFPLTKSQSSQVYLITGTAE
jgi:hypothetical protein